MALTNEDMISIARGIAQERGWSWQEPVRVRRFREGFWGPRRCEVVTNSDSRGTNVRVVFDEDTGAVVDSRFLPR